MPERQHANEALLVERAKKGDSGAFGELYEFYAPLVFRFLFAHTNDRQDAEDLTEEVFLRVWEALPGFRLRGVPFGGYLFRVARNALYDHYRRDRKQFAPVELGYERADDGQPDPAESVPVRIRHGEIQDCLQQLRDDYRTVVAMRFLVGLSVEETAAAMGRSEGAIRVLQHRALCALKQLLKERDEHES